MNKTIKEVADWIVVNRRGNAFRDYSHDKIVTELHDCSRHLSMLCTTGNFNEIIGVVCCNIDTRTRIIHVYDILTTSPDAIRCMTKYCIEHYPSFTIEGFMNGKIKRFTNTIRLLNKLQIYGI